MTALPAQGRFVWGRKTVGCVRKNDGSIDYLVNLVSGYFGRESSRGAGSLLMREINHRSKNILGLVQAMAPQTAAPEHEDFIERFAERIQALAANQYMLVRNDWRGIDVEDLARGQLFDRSSERPLARAAVASVPALAAPALDKRFLPKRLENAFRSSTLAKQNSTKRRASRRRRYISGATDKAATAVCTTSLFWRTRVPNLRSVVLFLKTREERYRSLYVFNEII